MVVPLLLFALFVSGVTAGKHDVYKGHTVLGVVINDYTDLQRVYELEAALDLDIWQHGAPGQREVHVLVKPEKSTAFLEQLDAYGIQHYVLLRDISESLEKFDADLTRYRNNRAGREALPFNDYPRHDEVNEYMERIAAEYPEIATVVTAGLSYENREIKYLKISTTNFTDTTKPIYFMDAMMHAREWVTTPVTLYSIHRLVEDLREQERDLLEGTDWIILPITNPDGYEYSHTDERLWRRTRSFDANRSTVCYGVDANRNFDVAFNTIGVSSDPCSQTYPGTTPFSEPETRILRDIMFEHLDRIQVFLNIHSQGNWILLAFGNSTIPANGVSLHHVGAVMGAAIDAVKLPEALFYMVGNSALLLYATSGSAQDYGQEVGIPFSYTLELPGYGYGFQVPPSFISQINEETWRGIVAQARVAKLHYNQRIGL